MLEQAKVGWPPSLRELKDLLYQVYLSAGAPSLDEITADIACDDGLPGAPSRDTIRRCISSPNLPPSQADAVSVAVVLARRARWEADDHAARVRRLWVRAQMAVPAGKSVAEFTDPFVLEVHRAIDTGPPPGGTSLPALPTYIERDHDRRLSGIVAEAAGGTSRLVVLVGGSSTGKTRACWEAIHALPDGWRLWHPFDPTRPEAALVELDQLAPRTVVWLNEAQHYLLTPAGDLGERVAAGLRALLHDPCRGPVLVLGTIWREYWATLTSPEGSIPGDPHAQARALLSGHDLSIPPTFTTADLRNLAGKAQEDPRLAHAAERAEEGQITQYLAGAPALIERYRAAPDAARALIEAAMDARRLGHGRDLPLALLETAVPAYVTNGQWQSLARNPGWLGKALNYVEADCRGALGPLTRQIPHPGEPHPAQACYRLADYLEQHGREHRRTTRIPPALWDGLLARGASGDHDVLGSAAYSRGLFRIAVNFHASAAQTSCQAILKTAKRLLHAGRTSEALAWYRRAVDAGHTGALVEAAPLLEQVGRAGEALAWIQRAAAAGQPLAMFQLAGWFGQMGRVEDALAWYQRAADAGLSGATRAAVELLERKGRGEEALAWYQRLAAAGQPGALHEATAQLLRAGQVDDLLVWLRASAEAGDPVALREASVRLERMGRGHEALDWLRSCAQAGHPDAPRVAAQLLGRMGRGHEVLDWMRSCAEAGSPGTLRPLAMALGKLGRVEEALSWYQRAVDAGQLGALTDAGGLLWRLDRVEEALAWYQRAIEAHQPGIFGRVAGLGQSKRTEEVLAWLRSQADAGSGDALAEAAWLLERVGRTGEAHAWYQRAADAGQPFAMSGLADRLERMGQVQEALTWYQRAIEASRPSTGRYDELLGHDMAELADKLEREGRVEDGIGWYQRAVEVGSPYAMEQAVIRLERAGRVDEALTWLQSCAEAGHPGGPLSWAAWLLKRSGRAEEGLAWYRRAAEVGEWAGWWGAVEVSKSMGRCEEAEQLRRYGWEADGMIAAPWDAVPPAIGPR
ncbi:tetratricopeptide repeat protein [Streptomyces sp. CA-135486]|uniref:tetratricopeptide repeat protein n=1 Tax=Streptomyces sp. CA-135486 TaxID=3240049 RepID=UPI003D8D7957